MSETNIQRWKSRPVFLSSTFRDMHAERDHLRQHVFPRLEEELLKRRHHLEWIDLRQGVESGEAATEEERELIVLKVCLDEIKRSRPFLIVLLGDRYGWVPPADRLNAAAREADFAAEVHSLSVTALEIEFGILKETPDQQRRCFFYLREPLPYDAMPPEVSATYSEQFATDEQAATRWAALEELKKRLTEDEEFNHRIRRYSVGWDSEKDTVTGLEAWGEEVFEDLWRELDEETREFAARSAPTWEESEREALAEFVEQRGRDFTGRDDLIGQLLDLAKSPVVSVDAATVSTHTTVSWGACVTGQPGAGKSALFARVVGELQRDRNVLVLANAAGTSPRSASVDSMIRRWIGELAAFLSVADPLRENAGVEEVDQTFASLLGRASVEQRVVVMLDAVNQFEPTPRAKHLTWRPKLWPPNARLIATTLPGPEAEAFEQWAGVEKIELPPLNEGDAREIGHSVWRRYHCPWSDAVWRTLAAKRLPDDDVAAVGNPLWTTLACEQLALLDADDFTHAERQFAEERDPQARLTKLRRDLAQRMPPDVPGLYAWLLTQTEKIHGEAWARAFAVAIALSRHGWREGDMRLLVPALAALLYPETPVSEITSLQLAALRRSFRAHLAVRGENQQWDFSHAQMRKAVEARLRQVGASVQAIHKAIADHLWRLQADDPIRETEIMTHLIGADDAERAARHYAGALSKLAEDAARHTLAASIIEAHPDDRGRKTGWACALLEQDGLSVAEINALFGRLAGIVVHEFFETGLPGLDLAFYENQEAALARLSQGHPANEDLRDLLGRCRVGLGQLLERSGQTRKAAQVYGNALSILEGAAPAAEDWTRPGNVHACYSGLARVFAKHQLASQAALANEKAAAVLASIRRAPGTDANPSGPMTLTGSDAAKYMGVVLAGGTWTDEAARHESTGNHETAVDAFRAACAGYEAFLSSASESAEKEKAYVVKRLAQVRQHIGAILLQTGQAAEAYSEYAEAGRLLGKIVEHDPGNASAVYGLCFTHEKLADALWEQGRRPEATEALLASLDLRRKLVAQDPANPEWQRVLALGLAKIGVLREEVSDEAGAQRYRAECGEILDRMRSSGVELEPRLESMRLRFQKSG